MSFEKPIKKEIPIFETKTYLFEKVFVFAQIILWLAMAIKYFMVFNETKERIYLFIILFFVIMLVQVLRQVKTFHLFNDKLIVRRPFFFSKKTETTFIISELKEIIFRKIKGRFGGPHIIIRSRKYNQSYRIELPISLIDEFIVHLTTLNIKATKDNM